MNKKNIIKAMADNHAKLRLDETMSNKLLKLSTKYPQMCAEYLEEMHKIISWGEGELKKIK